MSTQELNTFSVLTADHKEGQGAVGIFRAQYNKASLDEMRGQALLESKIFGLIEKIGA